MSYAQGYLQSLGVEIILSEKVVQQQLGTTFTTDQGRVLHADLAFLCTGIKSNADILKPDCEASLDNEGFAIVNDYLQLKGNKHIFVAGSFFILFCKVENKKVILLLFERKSWHRMQKVLRVLW